MFIGRESACIDVDVGVDFDSSDMQATWFEYSAHTAGYDPFTNARYHTTGHQYVLHYSTASVSGRMTVMFISAMMQYNLTISHKQNNKCKCINNITFSFYWNCRVNQKRTEMQFIKMPWIHIFYDEQVNLWTKFYFIVLHFNIFVGLNI